MRADGQSSTMVHGESGHDEDIPRDGRRAGAFPAEPARDDPDDVGGVAHPHGADEAAEHAASGQLEEPA
jgi:hypothetical protein